MGRRGRFIAFEGIDGSGKSSTLRAVVEALGPGIVATREETESPAGAAVRQAIAAQADPLAVTYLFLADRAQHAHWIRQHLEAGTHVVCDRYSMSTLAYQSVTLRARIADPASFLRALHGPIGLEPDRTLLFVGDPEACVRRVARRGATTAYEKVAFLASVQEEYEALARQDPTVEAIKAERPLADLVAEATERVRRWLRE